MMGERGEGDEKKKGSFWGFLFIFIYFYFRSMCRKYLNSLEEQVRGNQLKCYVKRINPCILNVVQGYGPEKNSITTIFKSRLIMCVFQELNDMKRNKQIKDGWHCKLRT